MINDGVLVFILVEPYITNDVEVQVKYIAANDGSRKCT
jgi:hypothetical protein